MPFKFRAPCVVGALLGSFVVLAVVAARHDAPTYDEPLYLTAGYVYLRTGHYWVHIETPPLICTLAAVPLLLMPVTFEPTHPVYLQAGGRNFSDYFLFHNVLPADKLLFAARMVVVGFGIALGLLIYFWAKQMWGALEAGIALMAYCFCPLILAHAHLDTVDLGFSFFFTAVLYFFWRLAKKPTEASMVAAGLGLGACIASKFSGILLIFILPLMLWAESRKSASSLRRFIACSVTSYLIAALFILAVYGFRTAALSDGLAYLHQANVAGWGGFLWGKYSTSGMPFYFLVALLIKTPIPMLLLLVAALTRVWESPHRSFLLIWMIFPAACLFTAASFSRIQVGARHILPMYPLICLVIGEAAARLWREHSGFHTVFLALAVWLMGGTLWACPYYIAYFNEFIGGSSQGYRYLVDSNTDWGQELKALGQFLKERQIHAIYLSYFGTADPLSYGIHYRALFPVNTIDRPAEVGVDLRSEQPVLLAISATNLQGVYYRRHDYFGWLKKRKPMKILGHSLFIYDLTRDREAHLELARLYDEVKAPSLAREERSWAQSMAP